MICVVMALVHQMWRTSQFSMIIKTSQVRHVEELLCYNCYSCYRCHIKCWDEFNFVWAKIQVRIKCIPNNTELNDITPIEYHFFYNK